jgi:hypothetical protein
MIQEEKAPSRGQRAEPVFLEPLLDFLKLTVALQRHYRGGHLVSGKRRCEAIGGNKMKRLA